MLPAKRGATGFRSRAACWRPRCVPQLLSAQRHQSAPGASDAPERVFVNSKLHIKRAQQQAVSRVGLIQCVPDAFEYLSMILNAKVYDVCRETELQHAPKMSKKLNNRVLLKREDTQPVYSFKLRGAYNKIVSLTEEERKRGIVACSAGNHAQGVAYSAARLGISAKIFMPVMTPSIKVDSVRQYANDISEVILGGDSYDDAYAAAMRCLEEEGRVLVHPFNDPLVIAGQGVIGQEIIKQSTAEEIEAVFCCVGGGGLLAGVGVYLKSVNPSIKVIGVEAADAPGMTESLRMGEVVELSQVGPFADGAAVKKVGDETFRLAQMVVDEMITVSTDEICGAIKDTFIDTRVVLEPAGALAVAGMQKYIRRTNSVGLTFVATTSGANMDFDRLRFISERADTSETMLSVVIPDRPGSFMELYQQVYPRNVTEFSYRIGYDLPSAASTNVDSAPNTSANICMSFQARSEEDALQVITSLEHAGFQPRDLSDDELAKTHGRHLVGGRGPKELTADERLFRFEFPERPGSLMRFLEALPSELNVSLFHYRNHGADVGRVLAALQIPPEQGQKLDESLASLRQKGFTWVEETSSPMYNQFLAGF